MKHLFIINPVSGSGKHNEVVAIIERHFEDKDDNYEIVLTQYPGHATELAQSAKAPCAIYSIGGDGTGHEILNGMADDIELCVVPVGSGNDFFRNYNIEFELEQYLIDCIEGKIINIDYATMNDIKFLNCSNIGFDAQVNVEVNKFRLKWMPRTFIYGLFALKGLINMAGVKFTLECDGVVSDHDALLASFMNGKYYGGGFKSAPSASLIDGYLNIGIVQQTQRRKIIPLLPVYYKGEHEGLDIFTSFQSKHLTIRTQGPIVVGCDGEILEASTIEFKVVAQGLKLRVPKDVEFN